MCKLSFQQIMLEHVIERKMINIIKKYAWEKKQEKCVKWYYYFLCQSKKWLANILLKKKLKLYSFRIGEIQYSDINKTHFEHIKNKRYTWIS